MVKPKHSKNGHRALTAEQQLEISRIQKRLLEYQARAGLLTEEAHKLIDQAKAADTEMVQALVNLARRTGNLFEKREDFDYDKLQFIPRPAAPPAPKEESTTKP